MAAYPLQALVSLREAEEKAATQEVAARLEAISRAQDVVAEARREHAAREADLNERLEDSESSMTGGRVTGAQLEQGQQYLAFLRKVVEQARARVAEAERAVETARAAHEAATSALAVAIKNRRAIESHRDAYYAAERVRQERALEDVVDDVAARAHRKGKGKGQGQG